MLREGKLFYINIIIILMLQRLTADLSNESREAGKHLCVKCISHVCFQVSFGMATGLVSVVLNVQQLIKLCLGD